ncbi:conserved hypothetical protein [Xenorhabdus bovienii str. puntauvense]|uniref:Uncharacterized protein n=1 Tax=Xenorhabdus bovienii str. puntauvense TaxID=1398201 RepID=A0A077NBV2_XENBV|nr:hypothetical protein [Xenorhabdus bovienii]CDG95450.1 conserved hypothetical protein [Xenorhabdus bovienii str. puntauvense]
MSKPHIHADLMMEYAKLAQVMDKPWEHFEVLHDDADRWCSLAGEFYFDADKEYRLKPRTIRIGSVDVPEPVRKPLEYEQLYFCPCVSNDETISNSSFWTNHECDKLFLQRGLIHLDHESAELHAKALISLTAK